MPEKGQLWPDEDDPVRHEEVGGGLTRIPAAAIVVVIVELPGAVGFIRWTPIGRFRALTFRHVQTIVDFTLPGNKSWEKKLLW